MNTPAAFEVEVILRFDIEGIPTTSKTFKQANNVGDLKEWVRKILTERCESAAQICLV